MMTEQRSEPGVSFEQAYVQLTLDWIRQTRAYVRSVRAYEMRTGGRTRRGTPALDTEPEPSMPRAVEEPVPVASVATVYALTSEPPLAASTAPLTRRQFEVAQLIARGLSNEEIARQLVLTPGTVGNHVGHMLRRLGAKNRAQVAVWVSKHGPESGADRERAS